MSEAVQAGIRQAVELVRQGRLDEAFAEFQEIVRSAPCFAPGYANLASVLLIMGRHADALAYAERALELDSRLPQALVVQGAVYLRQGKFEEALSASKRTSSLDPALREPYYQQALAYVKLDRLTEAADLAREALMKWPDYLAMEYVLGMAAMKENRLGDALTSFERILAVNPNDAQAHLNRALIWLLRGDYEKGWPEYEWRWRGHGFVKRPMWDGRPTDGQSIMLHAEQGLGDSLQFIRYAPLVKERGGAVLVACPERLHPLLRRCPSIDRLLPPATFDAPADAHALLMSLPTIFGTTTASIPATVPYVFPDPELVHEWRSQLAAIPGFKVGIAWQGSITHPDDRARSIPLAAFAPLAGIRGVHLISLQKKDGLDQLATAPFELIDLGTRLDEATGAFMDTAAVMMSLDLIITSDSAIAHLAGALGVPVWVALCFAPDFRWLLEREDSPWYPSMRLYRQRRRGNWVDVFETIAATLTTMA